MKSTDAKFRVQNSVRTYFKLILDLLIAVGHMQLESTDYRVLTFLVKRVSACAFV